MKFEESLNVRFVKIPPPTTSPLVDDELIKSQIVENQVEHIENKENRPSKNEIVNIKESKNHNLKKVIGKLNQRTLRSQARNQSNFFYFVSSVTTKNIYEAIKDESWIVAMQEELTDLLQMMFGTLFYLQNIKSCHRACVMDFGGNWDTHLLLVEFSYNNSYHKSIKCAHFEALYGHECRSPMIWAEVGESQLIRPEIMQETMEKIMQIKVRLKTTRSRQKSYADKRRKPLEFNIGDYVLIKVSPWKGVVRFGKKGKLAQRYVSNLKKCQADSDLQVPLEEIKIDDKLYFEKEPFEIVDRQVKKLKRSWIPIVKVRWDSRRGAEFTWEREDQFIAKYPHLFATSPSATVVS
nr:putative reverse transcriptase domain-containing protein [Tanacetum cinerariifolium]